MEARLFDPGTVPDCSTPEWYADRDRAHHLEEGAHASRLAMAATFAQSCISDFGACSVVDLGAGDGGLLSCLRGASVHGYDLQPSNVAGATERGVRVRLGDVLTDRIRWAEVALATEMLEHLVDPHRFLKRIRAHARFLVASSPAFETAENHYEFHLWAWDREGFRAMVEQAGWRVMEHRVVDGFQVLWARH
jgi:hypothetical protein